MAIPPGGIFSTVVVVIQEVTDNKSEASSRVREKQESLLIIRFRWMLFGVISVSVECVDAAYRRPIRVVRAGLPSWWHDQ